MAGQLERIRDKWAQWQRNRPHPWNRVKDWATRPKGKPRKVLNRWRGVQEVSKKKKEQAEKGSKERDVWRARFKEARDRAKTKLEYLQEREKEGNNLPSGPMTGTTMVDGRVVPSWMAVYISKIRARGNWTGVVVSGVRTPEYSESLCYAMCGQPTCPGRCAGRNSNHNATPPVIDGEGAIDVSDYVTFASEARAVGATFHNGLGAQDPVHFSRSGA